MSVDLSTGWARYCSVRKSIALLDRCCCCAAEVRRGRNKNGESPAFPAVNHRRSPAPADLTISRSSGEYGHHQPSVLSSDKLVVYQIV